MKNDSDYHESVMMREVLEYLHIKKQAWYIDSTLGTGGHSVEIYKKGGNVLGIDMDPAMINIARERLNSCPAHENIFKLVQGNFRNIDKITKEQGIKDVNGIVFDLGVSNIQLKGPGFSFNNEEADLDMRVNPEEQGVKASDLLNILRPDQLVELFAEVMPYSVSKVLAQRVNVARQTKSFVKVGDFLSAIKGIESKPNLHYATLPFLALRMAVNTEVDNLVESLPKAFNLLEKGGRLVVISFHSREDGIVDKFFNSTKDKARILTQNYISPSMQEIRKNLKARSARLRAIEKINE